MIEPLEERDFWLVDSLGVPSTVHDRGGRFVHVNAAAEQASGFSNAQMRGRELASALPAESHEAVEAVFRRAIENGEPTDFETIFVDASGETRGARVQQLPLRDGDQIIGVLTLAFGVRAASPGSTGLQAPPHLTERQREVLELIAAGHSTAEIAQELSLSTETVRNHLRNLFHALHAHSRIEAITVAQGLGLLSPHGLGPQVDDE